MTKPRSATEPIRLRPQTELEIPVVAPFHFVGTVHKPSHFPSSDVAFDGERYWQTMRFEGRLLGIRMEAVGGSRRPIVRTSVYATRKIGARAVDSLRREIVYRFDLASDLREFGALCRSDAKLREVWGRWGGLRASVGMSLYEFLVITTVLQNATVRRSVQMLDALFQNLGSRVEFDGQSLSAFWDVGRFEDVSEDYLRKLKLGYRAKTLKRQSVTFLAGELDECVLRRLPTAELRSQLLSLYGVGPASVGYLMFEVFKRYGALDYISPWEQKIFSRVLYDRELVPQETILSDVEQRWGSWKMLAMHYLFEDLFWRRRTESIPWLDELIRL